MNQSAIIAASLLAGFVLFLAARNRLSTYVAVLWGPGAAVPDPNDNASMQQSVANAAPGSSGSVAGDISTALDISTLLL